jgi:hypothetical protein
MRGLPSAVTFIQEKDGGAEAVTRDRTNRSFEPGFVNWASGKAADRSAALWFGYLASRRLICRDGKDKRPA